MTAEELIAKIDWEGSVPEVIRYGIGPDDVPGELREMWGEASRLVHELDSVADDIELALVEGLAPTAGD